MLAKKIENTILEIKNFPKEGVNFKDITPILKDPKLCSEIVDVFCKEIEKLQVDIIVGVESRGFLFGMMIAAKLGLPFVPIRKQGKLPGKILAQSYELEYGHATIEVHEDAISSGSRVMIHDDLLATGGTVLAVAELVKKVGAEVAGFCFVVNLDFLEGMMKIKPISDNIITLVSYK